MESNFPCHTKAKGGSTSHPDLDTTKTRRRINFSGFTGMALNLFIFLFNLQKIIFSLKAYPNWEYHSSTGQGVNCSGLISVYRIRADRCNRLWVLDSGVSNSLDDFTTVCPPKLLVFDMSTDRLVKSVTFPRYVIHRF